MCQKRTSQRWHRFHENASVGLLLFIFSDRRSKKGRANLTSKSVQNMCSIQCCVQRYYYQLLLRTVNTSGCSYEVRLANVECVKCQRAGIRWPRNGLCLPKKPPLLDFTQLRGTVDLYCPCSNRLKILLHFFLLKQTICSKEGCNLSPISFSLSPGPPFEVLKRILNVFPIEIRELYLRIHKTFAGFFSRLRRSRSISTGSPSHFESSRKLKAVIGSNNK